MGKDRIIRSSNIADLEGKIELTLRILKVRYRKALSKRKESVYFFIDDFGVVVCGIDGLDYRHVKDVMEGEFNGWRHIYITPQEDMAEEKVNIIWELARSGYLRWVRLNYPRQFNNFIVMEGFGKKIIDERLRIWGNKEKYRFFVEDNKDALRHAETYLLSIEPSFYDYIPEEEN